MTIRHNRPVKTRYVLNILLILVIATMSGCMNRESTELYHAFTNKSWARFDLLNFEVPVKKTGLYNIYLYARFTPEFQNETLKFNMIMNTPAGEERFMEYSMDIRSESGDFIIECSKDSCQGTIMLKKEIDFHKPGILKIEIENLIPRLTTDGVLGVGIRLVQSGK